MRLALNPRARRLLRRVPHTTAYTVLELLLLLLLAIQCARLFWTLVTPLGPVGDWRPVSFRAPAAASASLLGSFDPFFRLSAGGPATVTSLDLKLFGVSENRATGRGSAIIATPDGMQKSYAVGDEIMPGVKLAAVSFDGITIDRGGTLEQLFLDQSTPAPVAAPGGASAPASDVAPASAGTVAIQPATQPAPTQAPAQPPANLANEIAYQPRLESGRVTGVTLNPKGSGEGFRAAGLLPGDVVTAINGQQVSSAEQAQAIAQQLGAGGEFFVTVDRGGRSVPLRLRTRP